MKKTSFFYSVKGVLLILLAWMLLLDEAVRLNMSQGETCAAVAGAEQEAVGEPQRKADAESPEAEGAGEQMEAGQGQGTEGGKETGTRIGDQAEIQTEPQAEPQAESQTEPQSERQAETQTETRTDSQEQAGAGQGIQSGSRRIRVLLMDTGYTSYYHPSVTVFYQGEERTYTPSSPELRESPLILEEQEGGIEVRSIGREQGAPSYAGSLEITAAPEGLLLVNELPLETYLEAVVPSEMPSSYAQEALKAQAVCARTYACAQMQEERLKEYGADVDDSVSFQVYGNIMPQESTTKAVRSTAGQVLRQNGQLIQAYYFSTSSGNTSTDEIWGAEEPASYLKAVSCSFDQEEPWSSWKVTIPWEVLEKRATGLKSIEITRKNQSDAVTGLRVSTADGSFDLWEEYAIREFFAPTGCKITEKDGSETAGGSLLPSAYFTMETVPGESVTLTGRGFGHGVGMSQTAANQMAVKGYGYQEILDYFFKNVEIQQVDIPGGS